MKTLFILLTLFQIKHFVADYLLQGEYMLGKFKQDWGFLKPLLAHVSVHAAFTFLISLLFVAPQIALFLALSDAAIHFVMDRIKAAPKYMGRWKPLTASEWLEAKQWSAVRCIHTSDKQDEACKQYISSRQKLRGNILFWWALGFDQMIHHLTHYGIIYLIILLR